MSLFFNFNLKNVEISKKKKKVFMFAFSDTLWIPPQVFAKWKIWQRYIIEESFISMAYVAVKVLRTKSAFIRDHSGSVFLSLLPQILSNFGEVFDQM